MNPGIVAMDNTGKLKTRILHAAYYLFLAGGISTLAYVGYFFVDARNFQAREQDALAESRSKSLGHSEKPHPVIDGEVVGEIQVARIGLKAIIVQGDSSEILGRAIGHLPETALPGEAGNIALAAHRDTFFRPLKDIIPGDTITLKTSKGDFQYRVESATVVPPTAVEVLHQSGGRILTLITCFPFYYVGSAPNRFIVRARQIETWP